MKITRGDNSFEVAEGQYDQLWKDLISGNWEPATFRILEYFVDIDDVVIDLGAWIGPVSLYAAQIASEVYAVEPDPVAFAELVKNVGENPGLSSKIKCFKLAISKENSEFFLYARSKYGVSSSSLLPRIRDKKSEVRVEGITLSSFIHREKIRKIDFIKIDIEGGEFELLPAIADELKKINLPTLFISFHYNYLTEHQYYLKVKCTFLSKIMMKIEKWSGIELFGKINRKIVLNTIQSLEEYPFIYTESGIELNRDSLQHNPLLVKKHNLVFSKKSWELQQ